MQIVDPVRPLLTWRTPLHLIPKDWLDLIEPKIERHGPCWHWVGGLDTDGHPRLYVGGGTIRCAKRVAMIFWDWQDGYEVLHHCANISCLNPGHFTVTAGHWSNEDREPYIKKMSVRIARWGDKGQ